MTLTAQAARTVTKTADTNDGVCDADCSLREAIANYPTDSNIVFNIPASDPNCTGTACTITVGSTLNLTVFSPTLVTINGSGMNQITITGANVVRVFNINAGGTAFSLNALTIRNGAVAGNGAGISFTGGNSLMITNSTIRNNAATGNNRLGGGLFNGAGGSTLTISNSTFNDNTALGSNSQGGAIYVGTGTNNIANSTFSANLANGNNGQGGAIYVANSGPIVNINHGTFTLNSATSNANNGGGGIFVAGGTVNLRNTIVAQNTTSGIGPDVNGTFTSGGNNIIGNGTGSVSFINGVNNDQVGTAVTPINAMLAALADNLGPTQTHALMTGSPAVDKAATGLTTDQRGLMRPVDMAATNASNGTGEDIGAFEVQAVTAAPTSISGRVNLRPRLGRRTMVSMTNTITGETRYASTSAFGYFQFDDVAVGETYIFRVSSRPYKFSPQVLTILDNLTELEFFPQ